MMHERRKRWQTMDIFPKIPWARNNHLKLSSKIKINGEEIKSSGNFTENGTMMAYESLKNSVHDFLNRFAEKLHGIRFEQLMEGDIRPSRHNILPVRKETPNIWQRHEYGSNSDDLSRLSACCKLKNTWNQDKYKMNHRLLKIIKHVNSSF